eukprot:Em0006g983a
MARYARKGDGEPLLRVERPSSPSSQSTAHVISACFNDLLARKPLDAKEINNMIVSRKGESEYHDRYVESLKEVNDKYEHRIENLKALEQHLLQAKAKALAAEEKIIATRAETFSHIGMIGLPQEQCLLSQFLNEDLLAQYDLLIPSQYHPKIHLPQSPPKKTYPNYLKPTVTFNMHATVPIDVQQLACANDNSQSRLETQLRKDCIAEAENRTMKSQGRVGSVPTARSSNRRASTATSTGQLKTLKQPSCTDPANANNQSDRSSFFVAEPHEILFTNYQAGKTYELSLVLRNVSTTSQQLRIVPPHTSYFSICIDHFPNAEGFIAPGMHCSYKVRFTPESLADYDDHIKVVMHTGASMSVPLKGMRPAPILSRIAEHLDIRCLLTRLSLAHEIAAFKDDKVGEENFFSEGSSETEGNLEHPVIIFDPTNPGQPVFKTAIMENFSNVDVQFQWRFYRPRTELLPSSQSQSGGSQELLPVSSTIESKCSAFSVKPQHGTCKARERKIFVFSFLSDKAGEYEDLAHLLVFNIPELCLKASLIKGAQLLSNGQFSAISIQLHGCNEYYALEFTPSVISILEGVPFGAEVRKQFKISNPNNSIVEYSWNSYTDNVMGRVTVDPFSGSIVPGSVIHCELVIAGMQEGLILTNLLCSIKHCDIPLPLHIEIYIQPAVICADVPSLDFGLIPLGYSRALQLPIRSETTAALQYELRQKFINSLDKDYMDCACLSFAAPRGELQPYGKVSVTVECKPEEIGRLRSQLEILVGQKAVRCLEVRAEVQRPIVHLQNCLVHEPRAYIQTEVVKEVVLINETLIPTQFTWSSQLLGQSSKYCELQISPPTGRIGSHESLSLSLTAKWSTEGVHPEAIATCIIQGMEKPLFLCISAEVFGISVHYSVNDGTTESQSLCLDFGSNNPLRKASTMFLKVNNTSAIQTSLSLHVIHFPASKPPTPPTAKQMPDYPTPRKNKQLLHRTVNISDSASRSKNQITSDCISALLREGRGACFFIDTASAELLPFESKTIAITAYSDMWGEYKDELICEVKGRAPVSIPIKYEATGCPVVFQTTASAGQTILRFGIHSVDSSPLHRVLKLKNSSPFEIRIDWKMFNNIQDDNKMLDLIQFCGNPFPRQQIGQHVATGEGQQSLSDDNSTDCQLSFRVILKPHEGIQADDPFKIYPQQMLLPAHGQGVVNIAFHPTMAALHNLCEEIVSYALGYFSIDQQTNNMAHRPTGYDMEPLRINILAGITRPMLTLESDDEDDLHFIYPASVFIQDKQLVKRIEKTHHFVLKNSGMSETSFQIQNESKGHFSVTSASCKQKKNLFCLKANESIAVTVLFSLSLVDLKDKCRCNKEVCFTERIIAVFSNGFKQAFELSIKMAVPTLVLSPTNVEFGTVFLGRTCESVVLLSNNTLSDALWSLCIPPEFQCVLSANSNSGIVVSQQKSGNETIQFKFSPSSESIYKCVAFLHNEITGEIHQINISGTGSANEKFSDTWQCI